MGEGMVAIGNTTNQPGWSYTGFRLLILILLHLQFRVDL